MTTKRQHGGKRRNAGRKPRTVRGQLFRVVLSDDVVNYLRSLGRERAVTLEDAVRVSKGYREFVLPKKK
jgi:hypothetical protein